MEWFRVCIGFGDERFNGRAKLVLVGETGSAQRFAGQEAKPDFDLIQPTGRSRSEVELNPALILF